MHPGLFDDRQNVPANFAYGRKMQGSDHVQEVIKTSAMVNGVGLAARFNDIKEQKYASNIREPLAKGFSRGYQWPVEAEKENFAFGYATVSCETTKEIVNPQKVIENAPEVAQMYKKSHGNYMPGE